MEIALYNFYMRSRVSYLLFASLLLFTIHGCSSVGQISSDLPTPVTLPSEIVSNIVPTARSRGLSGKLIYVMDAQLYLHDLDKGKIESFEGSQKFLANESAGTYLSISPDQRHIAFNGIDPLFGCSTFGQGNPCVLTGPDGFFLLDITTKEFNLIAPYAISNLSWAQDSNKFVYAGVEFNQVPYRTALKISSPAGGEPKYLTSGENVDIYPSWSPNGDWIAFLRSPSPVPDQPRCITESEIYNTCTDPDLYIIRPDGTGLTLLRNHITVLNSPYNTPAWSPDGEIVAVITGKNADEINLIQVDSGTTSVIRLPSPVSQGVAWSPDGQYLLFTSLEGSDLDVFIIDKKGIKAINISRNNSDDRFATWSPDGKFVWFFTLDAGGVWSPLIKFLSRPNKAISEFPSISTRHQPLWIPTGQEIP